MYQEPPKKDKTSFLIAERDKHFEVFCPFRIIVRTCKVRCHASRRFQVRVTTWRWHAYANDSIEKSGCHVHANFKEK